MYNELFRLGKSDLAKGLVIAILAPTLTALATLFNTPGFALDSLDFFSLLKIAVTAGLSYLLKNFLSDSDGKVLGHIG